MQDHKAEAALTAAKPSDSAGYLDILAFIWSRFGQEKIIQLASSLTFSTVLAIVPLLAVVLSLFTAFPLFKEYSDALQDFMINSLMPPAISDNIMKYLNEFATQASRLTAIGGGFLILTVMLLIMSVESALSDIWHVSRQRPISQRLLVYWALISVGPILTGASLWTTAFLARESLGLVGDVPALLELTLQFIPFVLSGLGFAAIFAIVPNCKVRGRDALAGGFLTAVILEGMKQGFAYYISQFSTYTVIYGAFAALPVFLIWVYLSWLGILLGALWAANIPAIRINRIELETHPGAALIESILLMQALDHARDATPPGCPSTELMHALRIRSDTITELLQTLTELGMVANTQSQGQDRWVLACNPATKSLGPLFDRLAIDRHALLRLNQPELTAAITALIDQKTNPTLANVLLRHDNLHIEPLQSGQESGTKETQHA
jgi:membrane protein